MKETAAARDDGSGFERRLMDFHGQVESRKGVLVVLEVVFKKLVFVLCEHLLCLPQGDPIPQHVLDPLSVKTGLSRSQLAVGGRVAKVIAEGQANITVTFDDGGAEVLITLRDEKVLLTAKEIESAGLVWEQIFRASAAAVELLERLAKFGQAECDGRWERKDPRRHPLGPDVKTRVKVVIGRVQLGRHERLDLEVAVKAWEGGGFEVGPGNGGFRVRDKFEAEPEERPEVGRWRKSLCEVVEGQIGWPIEVRPGWHGGKVKGGVVVAGLGEVSNIPEGVMDALVGGPKDVGYLCLPADVVPADLVLERLRAPLRLSFCEALAAPRAPPDLFEALFRERPRFAAALFVPFPPALALAVALAEPFALLLPLALPRALFLPVFLFLVFVVPAAPLDLFLAAGALPPDVFFDRFSC